MTMRELTRCIAWTVGLGAIAFAVAVATNVGLAQSEGFRAWLVFAAYAPFYGLVHAFHVEMSSWQEDSVFLAAALVAQFLYFLAIVTLVRFLYRQRRRARR